MPTHPTRKNLIVDGSSNDLSNNKFHVKDLSRNIINPIMNKQINNYVKDHDEYMKSIDSLIHKIKSRKNLLLDKCKEKKLLKNNNVSPKNTILPKITYKTPTIYGTKRPITPPLGKIKESDSSFNKINTTSVNTFKYNGNNVNKDPIEMRIVDLLDRMKETRKIIDTQTKKSENIINNLRKKDTTIVTHDSKNVKDSSNVTVNSIVRSSIYDDPFSKYYRNPPPSERLKSSTRLSKYNLDQRNSSILDKYKFDYNKKSFHGGRPLNPYAQPFRPTLAEPSKYMYPSL